MKASKFSRSLDLVHSVKQERWKKQHKIPSCATLGYSTQTQSYERDREKNRNKGQAYAKKRFHQDAEVPCLVKNLKLSKKKTL